MPRIVRTCYVVGLLLIAAGVFHLGVFAVRGGPWEGPVSWRKPATFGLSFGVTLISIAWVTSYLRLTSRWRAWLLGIFAIDCVVEVAGITVQAWRRVPSHFNTTTPLNRTIATLLAVGGAVLVIVLVLFAVNAFRHPPAAAPSMRLALRAGFATLMVGLASGVAMIARGVALHDPEKAYRLGGFLKPVHGVSLHGVLVLPALAWLLTRFSWPATESGRVRMVMAGVIAYATAIAVALVYSLSRM